MTGVQSSTEAKHPNMQAVVAACVATPGVVSLVLLGEHARGDNTAKSGLKLAVLAQRHEYTTIFERLGDHLGQILPRRMMRRNAGQGTMFSADLRRRVDLVFVPNAEAVTLLLRSDAVRDADSTVLYDPSAAVKRALAEHPEEKEYTNAEDTMMAFAASFESASALEDRDNLTDGLRELDLAYDNLSTLVRIARYSLPSSLEKFAGLYPRNGDEFRYVISLLMKEFRSVSRLLKMETHETVAICRDAAVRDRFSNFCDGAVYVDSSLTPNTVYRGASPHYFLHIPEYRKMISEIGFDARVDLRSMEEQENSPVRTNFLKVVSAPIDPFKDLAPDDPLRNGVGDFEAQYRFLVMRCAPALGLVVKTLLASAQPILIHCNAGRDRTGVQLALLHLSVGISKQRVLTGFSAFANRADTMVLARCLSLLDAEGGTKALLDMAELSSAEVVALKNRLLL